MFVHDFLINSAERFPYKEAIIHGGTTYSYAEVLAAAESIAKLLLECNYHVLAEIILLDNTVRILLHLRDFVGVSTKISQ